MDSGGSIGNGSMDGGGGVGYWSMSGISHWGSSVGGDGGCAKVAGGDGGEEEGEDDLLKTTFSKLQLWKI